MWSFNVAREVLRLAGCQVEPPQVPKREQEMFQLAESFFVDQKDSKRVLVLKVHSILAPDLPDSKIICVNRDPRDVLVSFMQFMKFSFEESLACARDAMRTVEAYSDYAPDYLLMLQYRNIEENAVESIEQIAQFLEVPLSATDRADVAEKFSKANVRSLIAQVDRRLSQKISRREKVSDREIVLLSESNYRAFDLETGFQSGHVSTRRSGDWQQLLTESQKEQLDHEFGEWLERHGFAR